MSERFYSATPLAAGQTALTLTGDEAHHLTNVLRAQLGEGVTVFDGSGFEWPAVIRQVAKGRVELDLAAPQPGRSESAMSLTLAIALPKGDRQKWLIEKCVELGVRRFVPLITERGVAQPIDSALDRLRRQVVEATKQCGRARLMEIARPGTLSDLLLKNANPDAVDSNVLLRCLAQPRDAAETETLAKHLDLRWQTANDFVQASATARLCLIGPEGGFSEQELELAHNAGCALVDLGPQTLRVETAAIAVAAACLLADTHKVEI